MTKPRGHTGTTSHGNTRDVRVERLGHVTIYKRGKTFYLYHRESSKSVRRRVDGNLATARLVASQVNTALEERRPSPPGFQRTDAGRLVTGFLDYCEHVAGHSIRTVDRYRAALRLFRDFTAAQGIPSIDRVTEASVEEFVKWLRTQKRTRNGAVVGKQAPYSVAGIKFILSTCRTAINWAHKRRYLPPYSENPFSVFPLEKLRDRAKQEMGMNPLLVQSIFGHTSLDMTARYTHLGLESKRQALRQMFNQAELHKAASPA